MKFNYIFGEDYDEFEYEIDFYRTIRKIKNQLSWWTKDQLIDYIVNLDIDDKLEEEFYDSIRNEIEDEAREAYESGKSIEELEDYMINNRE